MPTLVYASTSPLVYILVAKIRKRGVILIGYMIMSISLFLVGPSKILGLYNSPALTILGLCMTGIGCGMIIIPVLPEMIEAIE